MSSIRSSVDRAPSMDGCEPDSAHIWNRGELLELIFTHVADALFLAGADGRIIDANPAACSMVGYTKDELLGMHPWDFVTSASREEIVKLIRGMERNVPLTIRRTYRR